MFSNNTETNITATYQDSDGTIDLAVSLPFSGLSDVNIGLSDADKFLSINGLGTGLTFVSQILQINYQEQLQILNLLVL